MPNVDISFQKPENVCCLPSPGYNFCRIGMTNDDKHWAGTLYLVASKVLNHHLSAIKIKSENLSCLTLILVSFQRL